nr:hypothetical protein [Sulfuricystis thermophila]
MTGLVNDPFFEFFEVLKLNYRNYPEVLPIRIAVHQPLLDAPIYRVKQESVYKYPPLSSRHRFFLFRPSQKSRYCARGYLRGDGAMPTSPLMEVVTEFQMPNALLLQIDTEGFDADVIKMIDFTRLSPLLIKFESKNLPPIRKQETYPLLQLNGYRLYEEGADSIAVHSKLT